MDFIIVYKRVFYIQVGGGVVVKWSIYLKLQLPKI